MYKNQGNFLIFEKEEGGSDLVSYSMLEKLLKPNLSKIDLVFIAACTSE